MWDKLAEIYASKFLTNRLCLKMELYQLKMGEGTSIHKHLSEFNMLSTQVKNTGDKIKSEEEALLLLTSLPKSYKNLVQSILVGKTTLKLKDVTNVLLENDRFLGEGKSVNNDDSLVVVGSRGRSQWRKGGGSRREDYSDKNYFYCGELGHIQYNCPKFTKDMSKMKNLMKETKGNEDATNFASFEDDGELLACEEDCDIKVERNNSRWILDSAASKHVCNDPSKFISMVK